MKNSSLKLDSESHLISQALEGNTQAVDFLYNRYLNVIYNYVYYRVGNKHDTEKLTEKIFLNVFDRLHQYPKSVYFLAWILKFASKEVARFQRAKKSETHEPIEYYLSDEQEQLMKALKSLNEKSYQFVIARFFNGLTEQATAEILGVNVQNVDNLQVQALKALEKLLKKDRQNG